MKGGEILETKQIEFSTAISDFNVINSDFTRARCKVFYTGRNRNYTDITENALNKLISRKGYMNVPVVAHLYKSDDGNWRVGGHDSKWILNNDGSLEIIDETIPFGVIPESCNPTIENVVEKSGEVKRYFCVDIILWTHRYNILDAVKSDEIWFNQSMEITFDHGEFDDDGYCVVDDFNLSALCLLNHDPYNKKNEVEPCFPSASVTKFSLDDSMKQEFNIMFGKLKEFENKKGENEMNISMIKEKLDGKYFALAVGANQSSVIAFDKASYELLEIPFSVNDETSEIKFDAENAVKKHFAVSDEATGISFADIKGYVETFAADAIASAEKASAEKFDLEKASVIKEFTEKIEKITADYEAVKSKLDSAQKQLSTYMAAEQKAAEDKHKAEINAVIDKYADKLYNNADYLMYKTKVDYSKTPEEIDRDMLVILGKANMNSNKQTFSAASWGTRGNPTSNGNVAGGRYGDLFNNFVD